MIKPSLPFSKKYMLYYDDTSSKNTLLECKKHYGEIDFKPTDVVLQCGANVGGLLPYVGNAKQVIMVESDEINYNVLQHNIAHWNYTHVTPINKAVYINNDETLQVFRRMDQYGSASSSVINRGRRHLVGNVTSVAFTQLIEDYNPNIVIIDIEGAEHDLIEQITDYVFDILFIEIHITRKVWATKDVDWLNMLDMLYSKIDVKDHQYFGKVICKNMTCYR